MERQVYQEMFEQEDGFWWHKGMRAISYELLKKFLYPGNKLKILDAGCGTGGNFQLLNKFGEVVAIDASSDALSFASKKNYPTIVRASVEKIPFAENTFDVVACFEVLYHSGVLDDQKAIEEFFRVLKPGGVLILREAAYDSMRSKIDTLVWTKHRYTLSELKMKIRKTGFKILKSTYVVFFLFPVAFLARTVEKMLSADVSKTELFRTNPILNYIFLQFLKLESHLLKFVSFPLGLSILVIAKKV